MKLNPLPAIGRMFGAARRKFTTGAGDIATITRTTQNAMGPWTGTIAGFIPRQVNPWLYEALRESIPILDGGLNRMVTMDGIVGVQGKNEKLVAEIQEWMDNIAVNDAEVGLQAFYSSQGNEVYEQGVAVGEFVVEGKDIVALRVADSKGIYFSRDADGLHVWYRPPTLRRAVSPDASDSIEAILRRQVTPPTIVELRGLGYVELDQARALYVVNNPEADNPYGASMLRSIEFVSQILLKIQNAFGRSWERFGDPPLHMAYNTKNRQVSSDQVKLDKRKDDLSKNLANALLAKSTGNSVDFVTAFGMDDTLSITVIGANGVALDATVPVGHLLQQIVSKFNLPPWMLGVPVSIAEGLAEQQSIVVLQESKTRFARRKPGLTNLVATMLRLRGRTWKAGDWEIVQQLPNLQDVLKQAQADFLIAQTELMRRTGVAPGQGGETSPRGVDNNLRSARALLAKIGKQLPARDTNDADRALRAAYGHLRKALAHAGARAPHAHPHKDAGNDDEPTEPWAEEDPKLPALEDRQTAKVLALWRRLRRDVVDALGLSAAPAKIVKDGAWSFDPSMLPQMLGLGSDFITAAGDADGPVVEAQYGAWLRGLANAGVELDVDASIGAAHQSARDYYATRGGALVQSTTGRAYITRVMGQMSSGIYDGMNPTIVAGQLANLFDAGDYDWSRLVRSEMAMAQVEGKKERYRASGDPGDLYDFITAGGGACPVCLELEAQGPYTLDACPVPVEDSHPNCRCTMGPHVDLTEPDDTGD